MYKKVSIYFSSERIAIQLYKPPSQMDIHALIGGGKAEETQKIHG